MRCHAKFGPQADERGDDHLAKCGDGDRQTHRSGRNVSGALLDAAEGHDERPMRRELRRWSTAVMQSARKCYSMNINDIVRPGLANKRHRPFAANQELRFLNRTPTPPPFSGINSIPAFSSTCVIRSRVAVRSSSPRSSRTMVCVDTFAAFASSTTPQPNAVRANLHWIGFISPKYGDLCCVSSRLPVGHVPQTARRRVGAHLLT